MGRVVAFCIEKSCRETPSPAALAWVRSTENDKDYTPLATKLARQCNMSRWASLALSCPWRSRPQHQLPTCWGAVQKSQIRELVSDR
jgi:hypothetical protein